MEIKKSQVKSKLQAAPLSASGCSPFKKIKKSKNLEAGQNKMSKSGFRKKVLKTCF